VLLLLVDVDAVVVVVIAGLLSEKPGAVYPVAVVYGAQKLKFRVCSGMKTSSGTVVATSFLYLTVYRWIAVDVPSYLNFAIKVTHPSRRPLTTLNQLNFYILRCLRNR